VSNSLQELNNYSLTSVFYEDERDYVITFSDQINPTIAVVEDEFFQNPVGVDILELVSPPRFQTYTIDLSAFADLVDFSWPQPLPPGISILNPGNNGIYSLIGIFRPDFWQIVRGPTIAVKDRDTDFTYTASFDYPDPDNIAEDITRTWTVNVNITAQPELSPVQPWKYIVNQSGTIAGAPVIVDAYTGSEPYTMVITPSNTTVIQSLSTLGSGGTVDFNPTTKVLTITGTKTQVNSHLSGIVFVPIADQLQSVELVYSLTNPISGLVSSAVQQIAAINEFFEFTADDYDEDVPKLLGYSVLDESATAVFTVTISQTEPNISTNPGQFIFDGAPVGNSLTVTGSRTEINNGNITYVPPIDWTDNIVLSISQSRLDLGNTIQQVSGVLRTLENSSTNPEISNMIDRSYTTNVVNNIFATSTPVLDDGPDIGQTYTITLTSSLGKFGNSAANAAAATSYSFTGNTVQVNNEFANMKFLATPGVAASTGSYTYTQTRNGQLQVTKTQTLTGSNQSLTPSTVTFTNNGTWTPTFEQAYFGNTTMLLVGGGGGCQYSVQNDGGAGAGGHVTLLTKSVPNNPLHFGTHTITIGNGGVGGPQRVTNTGFPFDYLGNSGGNTTVVTSSYTETAAGGQGGRLAATPGTTSSWTNNRGGNSQSNINGVVTTRLGGAGAAFGQGGGGAGAGQNGFSAGGPGPSFGGPSSSANGGNGIVSNISGVNVTYGPGGMGTGEHAGGTSLWHGGGYAPPTQNSILVAATAPGGGGTAKTFGSAGSAPLSAVTTGAKGIVIIRVT
jgi:hypothetical protein